MVAYEPAPIDLGFVLTSMRHAIDKLELEFSQFAAQFAQTDQWDREGFNSAGEWIRFNCHMNSNTAYGALTVGERSSELPQSVEAMREGDIGFAHLTTMARTADSVKGFDEAVLLPVAREHSPGKFHYKCLHYRHSVDAQGYNDDQEGLAEQRRLRMSTAQDGCLLLSGVLDPHERCRGTKCVRAAGKAVWRT